MHAGDINCADNTMTSYSAQFVEFYGVIFAVGSVGAYCKPLKMWRPFGINRDLAMSRDRYPARDAVHTYPDWSERARRA